MRIDRRRFLTGIGAAALTPGIARCPAPPDAAPAEVTPALLRERVKTVVFVMLENRSFDQVFGSLSLVEGRTDVDGLSSEMQNPLADGSLVFPALAEAACVQDPAHSFDQAHEQWNNGANDSFVRVHERLYGTDVAPRVMQYLDRSLQPTSYALADNYALCQRWFSSVMGPTWPNRYYSMLGTSNGSTQNIPLPNVMPSLYGRLDKAGISWNQFYGNLPFSALLVGHSVEQAEYQKLDAFFESAAAGTLPSFVHIDPTYGLNDDHPPAHPLAGQILLSSIYAALARSPQWNECLLAVTYDENGGFFDHVAPPTTIDALSEFNQLGFRVPALVVGPYVKPQVTSTVFDHTAILSTLLRQHELPSLTLRDESGADLWSLLDTEALLAGTPSPPITLAPINVDESIFTAPECRGRGLHVPSIAPVETGQPELEAFFDGKSSGVAEGPAVWARVLAHARDLGVLT